MKKQIVYVASSVTNASSDYRRFVRQFKEELRTSAQALVLEWVEQDSQAIIEDFYRKNFNNVRLSDVIIAIVDEPSIGVGMEIGEAMAHDKPLLCLHKEGKTVSRLLRAAQDSLDVPVQKYKDLRHAVKLATDFVSKHEANA